MSVDTVAYKQTLSKWASGVTVITTKLPDGTLYGMTASSFSSLSLDPLLVLVCIGKRLNTHQYITESGIFAINILSTAHIEWGKRFAGMIAGVEDRFAGISYHTEVTGSPILPGTLGWLDCHVAHEYDGGDHTIFVGSVTAVGNQDTGEPLLYYNRHWGQFIPTA